MGMNDSNHHHDNPVDFPCAWVREETLSDIELDGAMLADASRVGRLAFRRALKAYAEAVTKQDPRLLAGDPDATIVCEVGEGKAQPATLMVANGPQFSLALVLRWNRLDVVDVGNAP